MDDPSILLSLRSRVARSVPDLEIVKKKRPARRVHSLSSLRSSGDVVLDSGQLESQISPEPAIENHRIHEEDQFRDNATYRSGRSSLTVDSLSGSIPPFAGNDESDTFSIVSQIRAPLARRDSLNSYRSLCSANTTWESVGDANPARQVQRVQHLKLLKALPTVDDQYEICKEEQERRLLQLAREAGRKQELVFFRFDRLASLCLFHYQHELIKMDEMITQSGGILEDTEQLHNLRMLLLQYYECVRAMRDVSDIKRPGMDVTRRYGGELARNLNEPRYWDSPDALSLFDLSPDKPEGPPDKIRDFFQRYLPKRLLDEEGIEWRRVQEKRLGGPMKGGTAKIVNAFKRQPYHVSPFDDSLSRLLTAMVGATFLLVPMAVMTLLPKSNEEVMSLVVTVVFVVLFAISISLSTEASNQEVLGATAAYTAVLVVFVGTAMAGQPPAKT